MIHWRLPCCFAALTLVPKGKNVESSFNDTSDLSATSNYSLDGTITIILSPSNYYLVIKLMCRLAVRQRGNKH